MNRLIRNPLLPCLLLFAVPATAQGPLEPPSSPGPVIGPLAPVDADGNPQPVMKTLHQLEPRTPITPGSPGVTFSENGNVVITAAGSYYLTRPLVVASGDGITIDAPDVTLDLNGYRISSAANPAAGTAIECTPAVRMATIVNGQIFGTGSLSAAVVPSYTGPGFVTGIRTGEAQAYVSGVQICGVAGQAIHLSRTAPTMVENCSVRQCGSIGITAVTVINCAVTETLSSAIRADLVMQCSGSSRVVNGIEAGVVGGSTGITGAPGTLPTAGITADLVTHSVGQTLIGGRPRSITATIATSCYGIGTTDITHKFDTP